MLDWYFTFGPWNNWYSSLLLTLGNSNKNLRFLHILLLINNMVMIAILYSNTKLVWSLTISDDLYSIEKIKKRKNSD
jgi:hypothetical protein